VLNSDLATRLAADRLLLLEDQGFILNVELQAQRDSSIRERMLEYAAVTARKYKKPVRTVVILLCRTADGKALRDPRIDWPDLQFKFRVIRVWQESPEDFFSGSPALLALLPLSKVSKTQLPELVRRMTEVTAKAYDPEVQKQFWGDTLVYMGLKHDQEFCNRLLEGVFQMLNLTTSSTYKGIFAEGEARGKIEGKAEGKAEGARQFLIDLAAKRLGEPDAVTRSVLEHIDSPQRLVALGARLSDVESWDELLMLEHA